MTPGMLPNAHEPVRLHRKQFIVGPEPVRVGEDWLAMPLSERTHLSHCPELRARFAEDGEGRPWALLGLAVQSVAGRPDPLEEIRAASDGDEIQERYTTWAGRWALIGDDRIHPDATAMLGVFHGKDGRGQPWASSSPALLCQCLGVEALAGGEDDRLTYERGITWHPLPRSAIDGVSHLLPSAVLNMTSGEAEHRSLLPGLPVEADGDAALEQFAAAMVESCRRLAALDEEILVSLSAGGDSRLVLACAAAAGLKFKAFTRISKRMSVADYLLPPMLCRDLGIEHFYIRPPGADPQRIDMVRQHTADHVPIGEAQPLIEGHRDALRGITLGGQCIGIGKVVFRLGTRPTYDSHDDLLRMILKIHGVSESPRKERGLREWMRWMDDHPVAGLDWRDRFFLEQRMAGWQSAKEQLYDMQPHERFIAINCARTYALVLSIPENRRATFGHHVEIIHRLTPTIGDYPLNPPDSYFGLLRAAKLRLFTLHSWREPMFLLRTTVRDYRKQRAKRKAAAERKE